MMGVIIVVDDGFFVIVVFGVVCGEVDFVI